MLICGLDLETTGLDVENDEIIEVGAVLWDTERKLPLKMYSEIVKPKKPISDHITRLTGICQDDANKFGVSMEIACFEIEPMFSQAAAIVAHNGNAFDKPMLASNWKRADNKEVPLPAFPAAPWIDTGSDVPYPDTMKTRKLIHLAAEHGFLNPFAHRALFDVLTMLTVLSNYDVANALALAQQPVVVLQALCEKPWEDDGKSTAEAKANGFYWEGKTKRWLRSVRQSQVEGEKAKATLYKVALA